MHANRASRVACRANGTCAPSAAQVPDPLDPLPPARAMPRPRTDQITPADVGFGDAAARAVYVAVSDHAGVMRVLARTPRRNRWYRLRRAETGSRTLTALAEELCDLANAGAPEADARRFELFVRGVVDACYCGTAHRTLDELDLVECALESAENQRTLELRVGGETPERLEAAAEANEDEVVVSIERARLLRRRARVLRAHAAAPRAAA